MNENARSEPEPLTARQLAEQLLRHPDAVVQVALPRELYVLDGSMFFPNDDGSLQAPAQNGVVMLTLDIGKYL